MPRGRRRAEAEIGASSRRLDPELRKARRKFRLFGREVGKDLKSVGRIGTGARRALSFLGVGTTAALGLAAGEVFNFEKALTRLQIQAGRTPREMAAFRDRIDEVSRSSGIAREELLDVSAQFVSLTGDMATAEQLMETFARTARASGSATADLARVAFSFQKNFQIQNPEEFERAFSIVLSAGKQGSVELKEMASLLTTIAPAFTKFGDTGAEGLAKLSAAFQVVQSGFAGPAEAATGLNAVFTALAKNADRFKAAGINVFERGADGSKQLRDFRDIIEQIANSKLAKDPQKLIKAFGRVEAVRAFDELAKFRPEWDSIAEAARKADDVVTDSKIFDESAAGQMQRALATLKTQMAQVFTPERIEMFAGALNTVVAGIEEILEAFNRLGWAIDRTITKYQSRETKKATNRVGLIESGKRFGFNAEDDASDVLGRIAAGTVNERDIRAAREFLRESERLGLLDKNGNVVPGAPNKISREAFGSFGVVKTGEFGRSVSIARRVSGLSTPSERARAASAQRDLSERETAVGTVNGLPSALQRYPGFQGVQPSKPVRLEHTFRFDQDMNAQITTRENREQRRTSE